MPKMKLAYNPTGQRFMFVMGDSVVALHNESRSFGSRAEAEEAAARRGLKVKKNGEVVEVNPSNMNGLEGSSRRPLLRLGTRVTFIGGGIDDNKSGIVVDRTLVKVDGRGIPTNVSGAYKPVNWNKDVAVRLDEGRLITSPKSHFRVDKTSPAGFPLSEYEGEYESMSYGQMPPRAGFLKHTEGQYPYPIELAEKIEKKMVERIGLVDMDGVEEFVSEYPGKLGLRVVDAKTMYRFLTKLKDEFESGEGEEHEVAGDLASSILYTLGYEWI